MTIVPRWEWRTFGDDFGAADERFAALSPDSVQESDEIYLLSLESDECVKIRDGLLDVKHLELVNDDGLEQWKPIAKEELPVSAAELRGVLAGLGAAVPDLARAAYTVEQLVDEVVEPSGDLRAVQVHKRRVHYMVAGCMAELTELRTDGAATRTIAIESEDAARVSATVREVGLGSRRNVSMPRGLKRLVGFGLPRYAVIDVGTNSVKFQIAERGADGSWRKIVDRADVTRLGEGLEESGSLNPEPMRRTADAIAAMAREARDRGVDEIAAVGTAGLRIARNSADFVRAVEAASGVHVEVISGEEEARLAYLAARSGLGLAEGSVVVFDTGGGSTQFTFGDGEEVDARFSLDVGAVRLTEEHALDGVVSEDRLAAALEDIAADLAPLDGRSTPAALVGMGGAVTNLAAVKHELAAYDPEVVQGTVLDLAEIDRQIELYRTRTAEERRAIVGLQANRAEVILAGACIVRTVLVKLGSESLTVSDRGLRHGVLAERFGV
jgi:exopolyphosphatase/guanosine-5'-triphosphate,3'-diphosphate pyrophosphatase